MRKVLFILFFLCFLSWGAFGKTLTVNYNFPLDGAFSDISETIEVEGDTNAFSAFMTVAENNGLAVEISWYDLDSDGVPESAFINSIGGIAASADFTKYWQFSVNNTPSMVGISDYVPLDNETISFDYFEGSVKDAIEWMTDHQQPNGLIGGNLFQSAFALTGLSLSAEVGQPVIDRGVNWFLSQQESDAGFGNELYTSVAVMALLSNGKSLDEFMVAGKTSVETLVDTQQGDGGFKSWGHGSDVDTTSWSLIALKQAGASLPEKNGLTPLDYLLSVQHPNGSFGYNESDLTESIDFTEEALIAIGAWSQERDNGPWDALNWLSSRQRADGCIQDGFRTALGALAFLSFEENENAAMSVECLKTLQNGDGSFGRSTNPSNAMDTGLAVVALSGRALPLTVEDSNGSTEGTIGLNSIVKFLVKIKNSGNVKAEDVGIELEGIPSDWIYSGNQGSVDSFDRINPGEAKTGEIYVKMKRTGAFLVRAIVSTPQAQGEITSNDVSVSVEESVLSVTLSLEE